MDWVWPLRYCPAVDTTCTHTGKPSPRNVFSKLLIIKRLSSNGLPIWGSQRMHGLHSEFPLYSNITWCSCSKWRSLVFLIRGSTVAIRLAEVMCALICRHVWLELGDQHLQPLLSLLHLHPHWGLVHQAHHQDSYHRWGWLWYLTGVANQSCCDKCDVVYVDPDFISWKWKSDASQQLCKLYSICKSSCVLYNYSECTDGQNHSSQW